MSQKNRIVGSLLIIVLMIIFISCSDNLADPKSNESYFPLSVGNSWTYSYDFRTPDGIVTRTIEHQIIAEKNVDGLSYAEFSDPMPFFPNEFIIPNIEGQFLREDDMGNILTMIDSTEYLYFLFDNAPTDSMIQLVLGDLDYWINIESKDHTIDSAVGSFPGCHKVLCYFPEVVGTEYFIWFSPGTGPVQIYYPEYDITYKLTNYSIN